MGAGVEELTTQPGNVAVDEDAIPRHEHVVEHQQGVGLVVTRRQRVVEAAGGGGRVRTTAVELETGGGHGHRDADREVTVVVGQRLDARDQQLVGHGGAGGEHLRAPQHQPLRALLDHTGLDVVALPGVRRRGARYLWRDDRVGDVELLGDQLALVGLHVLGEVVPTGALAGERLRVGAEAGEERADVVGRATHPPVGVTGPGLHGTPERGEVLGAAGREIDAVGLRPGLGVDRPHIRVRCGGQVVELGDGVGGGGERGVGGDVVDALAVHVDLAVVAQRGEVALAVAEAGRRGRADGAGGIGGGHRGSSPVVSILVS